jgi:hypothetical protein
MDNFETENSVKIIELEKSFVERLAALEISTAAKLAEIDTKNKGAPMGHSYASAAAASSAPATAKTPGTTRAARPSGPARTDENCMVLIRGFPEQLPRSVLLEQFNEMVQHLPDQDQLEVKARIQQVDTQIIMTFPTSAKADGFLEIFNSNYFVYEDPDSGIDTPLTAKKGRPLAVRRRGGATHPVYEKAETLLNRLPNFESARLIPNTGMKKGIMQTEFLAGVGRKVTPLFTIFFLEEQHETIISTVEFADPSIFSASDCDAICAAAGLH